MSFHLSVSMVLLAVVCSAPCRAADPEPESPGVVQKVERAVQRGAEAAASGAQRGAKAAARGVEHAASATARGVKAAASGVARGANAAARGVESAASKVVGPGPASSSASR